MLRTTFLAKLAGAFALGRLLPLHEVPTFEYVPANAPKFVVRMSDPPTAVEAQYWIDRGFTHCAWAIDTVPLTRFATPIESITARF